MGWGGVGHNRDVRMGRTGGIGGAGGGDAGKMLATRVSSSVELSVPPPPPPTLPPSWIPREGRGGVNSSLEKIPSPAYIFKESEG